VPRHGDEYVNARFPDASYPLGGELTGFRELAVGRSTWRIAYRVVDEKQVGQNGVVIACPSESLVLQ
jgi:hypothetical protein